MPRKKRTFEEGEEEEEEEEYENREHKRTSYSSEDDASVDMDEDSQQGHPPSSSPSSSSAPVRTEAERVHTALALIGAETVVRRLLTDPNIGFTESERSAIDRAMEVSDPRLTPAQRLGRVAAFLEWIVRASVNVAQGGYVPPPRGLYFQRHLPTLWNAVNAQANEARAQARETPREPQSSPPPAFNDQILLGQQPADEHGLPVFGSQDDSLFTGLGGSQDDSMMPRLGDSQDPIFQNARVRLPLPECLEWAAKHEHAVTVHKVSRGRGDDRSPASLVDLCEERAPGLYDDVDFHDESAVDRAEARKLWDAGVKELLPDVPFEEYLRGLVVETEHGLRPGLEKTNVTNNLLPLTSNIAVVHLMETPYYYVFLEMIEALESIPGSRPCEDMARVREAADAFKMPLRLYIMMHQRGGAYARRAAFVRDAMTSMMGAGKNEIAELPDVIHTLRQQLKMLEHQVRLEGSLESVGGGKYGYTGRTHCF